MKKRIAIIALSILLAVSLGLNVYFYSIHKQPKLTVQVGHISQYTADGEISATIFSTPENHRNTQIILNSLLNLILIEDEQAPDSLPEGIIMVNFGSVGYKYSVWLDQEDCLILSRGAGYYRKGVSLRDLIPWKNIGIVWSDPAMPIFSVRGAVRLRQ